MCVNLQYKIYIVIQYIIQNMHENGNYDKYTIQNMEDNENVRVNRVILSILTKNRCFEFECTCCKFVYGIYFVNNTSDNTLYCTSVWCMAYACTYHVYDYARNMCSMMYDVADKFCQNNWNFGWNKWICATVMWSFCTSPDCYGCVVSSLCSSPWIVLPVCWNGLDRIVYVRMVVLD